MFVAIFSFRTCGVDSEGLCACSLLQGTSLAERLENVGLPRSVASSAPGFGRATRKLDRWKKDAAFSGSVEFSERLDHDSLTEAGLVAMLIESDSDLAARFERRPRWVSDVVLAFESEGNRVQVEVPSFDDSGREPAVGFVELSRPLLEASYTRLHRAILDLVSASSIDFDITGILNQLFHRLCYDVLQITRKTLALELNVARVEERLGGGTGEERFLYFVDLLRVPDVARGIMKEYPVMAKQVALAARIWEESSLEFFNHLVSDWGVLRQTFLKENCSLLRVRPGAGDRHRGGRTVVVCEFDDGSRVVYKPRSMAVDVHFQELLLWLNERIDNPPFKVVEVLDCGNHGWMAFVEALPCSTAEGVRRFYRRQGGYLAVLYALETVDIHYENMIAHGNNPILVDLESLFHPRVSEAGRPSDREMGDLDSAGRLLLRSVLRVGMLPMRSGQGDNELEVSALGGAAGQTTPYRAGLFEESGTDRMRVVRRRVEIPGSQNRPILDGKPVEVQEYADDLERGFASVYRALMRERRELLSAQGPLMAFAADEVRMIFRPTSTYGVLLTESYHPDLLRNGLDRDRHFDRLWTGVDHQPHLRQVLVAEREDLERGDVPVFTVRPGERHLWTSERTRITDYFPTSSMAAVHERISQLSEKDLELQCWCVRAAVMTLDPGEGPDLWLKPEKRDTPRVGGSDLCALAGGIADRIEHLAIWNESEDQASWLGVALVNEEQWTLAPLGLDLYSGTPGVVLFLAYLADLKGPGPESDEYVRLAKGALRQCEEWMQVPEERGFVSRSLGAFSGMGGLIYMLTHLGVLWKDDSLIDDAHRLLAGSLEFLDEDEELDIIGGTAGLLGAAVCLCDCRDDDGSALSAALQAGESLLARATIHGDGVAWQTRIQATQPLCGFSHGASGFAWALLRLAEASGDRRFLDSAKRAMLYERSVFDAEKGGDWPDFREERTGPGMCAWCHGAAGIGMTRVLASRLLDSTEVRTDLEIALEITLERGFSMNHSLCHGQLGNLDLLLQALDGPLAETALDGLERVVPAIVSSFERGYWLCGTPRGIETPGLLTGLSGLGFGLLRLAAPERVPSILTLEPPRKEERPVLVSRL